ncbi:GtrA family protein [Vibrio sp. CAU 1672]|uniref:GtrA family protein n=1 Tax=Vibrio sp. CAU 1672 TaxID=3032594 RepID=UPI0023DB49E3|nr:GtrA family protein [Vibrio sp. CAU 1672]MDF2154251.1 GtrA family protein [Vibrio sp. CAU 1672]
MGNNVEKWIKFAIVGGIGFCVDTFVFTLLFYVQDLDLMIARILAFMVAATSTWAGNRYLTFAGADRRNPYRQWQKFILSATISALPNLAVFKMLTILLGEQGMMVYLALVAGILVGMVSNYLLSSRWVFAK